MGSSLSKVARRLIADIASAFANVELGNGVTLHQARAMDDYESEAQQLFVRSNDTEPYWCEIPDDKLKHFHDVLVFMDDEGWVFYIPAFMTWILRHLDDPTDEHSGLDWSAILSLTDPGARVSLLNEDQSKCVCRFLRYLDSLCPDIDLKRGLELYWGWFCPPDCGD
jgi:hypothetical protein